MSRMKTGQKRKIWFICVMTILSFFLLSARLCYLMLVKHTYYNEIARDLHERERKIKAKRGLIVDCNGVVLADNETVCTISVVHSQIEDKEKVIEVLSTTLGLSEEAVRKRVEKKSSREKIKSNVSKELGDEIRKQKLSGVKVDEDYKRWYPYGELGSKVLGFTGADNQGILGLELVYDKELTGQDGYILTTTDAKGIECNGFGERRIESIQGNELHVSLDLNIQSYATQLAKQALETKQAKSVSIMVMNVNNGEILAMTDVPEFNLNQPFEVLEQYKSDEVALQDQWNQMWRNSCIQDTYEPGSIFKIITATAALEEHLVSLEDRFYCPGYIVVDDRRIRCARVQGHGAETFVQGFANSCNPVFISVGQRVGAKTFYSYFKKLGLLEKTGVDLTGEANTIMHKPDNIGNVELATISFGQSFQITPLRLLTTVSSLINGGHKITPHFGVYVCDEKQHYTELYPGQESEPVITEDTVEKLRYCLEQVVENGGGKNGKVEGFRIGGKTATSQTLPRNNGKYISAFLGFWPANDPKVIAMAIITHPKGQYYGGMIAAPVVRQLFENILPYLEDMDYN